MTFYSKGDIKKAPYIDRQTYVQFSTETSVLRSHDPKKLVSNRGIIGQSPGPPEGALS